MEPQERKSESLMTMEERAKWLAALGWDDSDICKIAGFEVKELPAHPSIAEAIETGRLEKRAEMEIAVARKAASGDIEGVKQYREITRDRSFSFSKLDLFGGAEKDGVFQRIQDYIAEGSKGNLQPKEQVYIDILSLIHSLDGQYGKRRTIRFLTSEPFSLPYDRATDMYAEATELFYANRKTSKEALRAKMADQFDSLYIAARDAAQSTKDYQAAAEILSKKAKVLRLDAEDPQRLPPEAYLRPYRVLSVAPESIGLPAVNRTELSRQIDEVVGSENVRRRLRMEAGILSVNVEELLDGAKEET